MEGKTVSEIPARFEWFQYRYECTLPRCPFADSTAVVHCVLWMPDGREVLCPYAVKVPSKVEVRSRE